MHSNNSSIQTINQVETYTDVCKILCSTKYLDEKQFKEIRRTGIGGSDAPGLLGMSRYKSPLSIYVAKTGILEKNLSNDYIRWGNILEPVIRREFTVDFKAREGCDLEVAELPYTFQSKTHPFMIANLDGVVLDPRIGKPGGLEIKTANAMQAGNWKNGEVPDDYYCQVQHYMAVLNLDYFYLVCLLDKRLIWRYVPRNDEFIEWLIQEEKAFWENHILPGRVPAPTGMDEDGDILQTLYANPSEEERVLLNGMEEELARYEELSETIKAGREAEKERKLYANRIKAHLENAHKGESAKYEVTWSRYTQTRIDSGRLKKEKPEIYQDYSKTSETGRLTVKAKEAKETSEEVA